MFLTIFSNAIIDFVTSLCTVSKEEVALPNPRIFSLQKLVEIATFNMNNRIRLIWVKMWKILADHFTSAGSHENKRVAMYAIDSLRQLSMKFLEKDELANFNFQKEFLKPFEYVINGHLKQVIVLMFDKQSCIKDRVTRDPRVSFALLVTNDYGSCCCYS